MQIPFTDTQQSVQLVQITDTHLGRQPGETILGMDADASLGYVLQRVRQQHPQLDLLLATGDISNNGSAAAYQRFQQLSDGLASHTLWLPGNHDTLAAMEQAINHGEKLDRVADVGSWRIIMLDSTLSGEVGGNLSTQELAFLRQSLQQTCAEHVLVCLHHHPIDIGCDWLDEQRVANAEDFFAVLDDFNHVRGVLWGHIHQTIDQLRNGVRLMATPSSCIQFAPNSADFKLDRLNPGYRWLELCADGVINSDVFRVEGVTFDIDYDHAGGY